MPKLIRELATIVPADGDFVAIDRTGGTTGKASISTNPTPNTLALRNALGTIQQGTTYDTIQTIDLKGLYVWDSALPHRWLPLVKWTGFVGPYNGLFADLRITRVHETSLGSRLRVKVSTDQNSLVYDQTISLAHDLDVITTNAVLVQSAVGVFELWAYVPHSNIYIEGVAGADIGNIIITSYGDIGHLLQNSPPVPMSGGIYLDWLSALPHQTFLGPGYITSALREPDRGYIRYDNGYQVCWGHIDIDNGTWVFPAAFSIPPRVQATAVDTVPSIVILTSVSTTSARVLRTDHNGNVRYGTVYLYAIGIWK